MLASGERKGGEIVFIGAFVPADANVPVTDTVLGGGSVLRPQHLCARLGAPGIRRYEMPPVCGAIVISDDAARSGQAINSRASSILWLAAPALSPWLMLHGDALIVGYDTTADRLCGLTPQMQEVIDEALRNHRRRRGDRHT
jgi:hypothetical protein